MIKINDYQKRRLAINFISAFYNTGSGKKITFYKWAFIKDINDTQELAAIYVANTLWEEQAEIVAYHPKVSEVQVYGDFDYLNTRSEEENRKPVTVVNEPLQATENTHAIAILA